MLTQELCTMNLPLKPQIENTHLFLLLPLMQRLKMKRVYDEFLVERLTQDLKTQKGQKQSIETECKTKEKNRLIKGSGRVNEKVLFV